MRGFNTTQFEFYMQKNRYCMSKLKSWMHQNRRNERRSMMKYQSQEEVCIVVLDEFTKHFALSFHLI
jgi:hypothetical protein